MPATTSQLFFDSVASYHCHDYPAHFARGNVFAPERVPY